MKASHRVLKSASYTQTVGIVLCLVLLGAVAAWGDPPVTINIRGQLLNPQGQALPGAREYRVQFYDAGTDGTALGAALTGTAEVSLEGLFNVEAALPASALSAVEVWYEFTISSAATAGPLTGSDTFPNRVKVVSVPFALESGTVTHVDVSAIGSGTVLDAEFGYLTGLTGGIQGQLDAKANSADVYTKTDADSRYATASHIHDGANITTGKIENARLKTGADNGLDADTVDGAHASDFATASHTQDWTTITGAPTTFTPSAHFHSGADITSGKVDNAFLHTGAGNELDADKVDGAHASDFASASHNHDTSYWKLGGNSGTADGSNYLGTSDNVALELRANGVRAFRLEPNTTSPNVIGGYLGNTVASGIYGATIGGGGYSGNVNTVSGNYGTVAGGYKNTASGYSAVAGGNNNTASGSFAAVGGGGINTANGGYSTVAGGFVNTASGNAATVAGGNTNTASGSASAVAGGYRNNASGDYATVAGGGPTDLGNPTTTNNNAYSPYCTVSGGGGNIAGVSGSTTATYNTVGGGYKNTATGSSAVVAGGQNNVSSAVYSTVGGGNYNTASAKSSTASGGSTNTASADSATVGGGYRNTANSQYASVVGGAYNTASNYTATVSGGNSNTASGAFSMVAGGAANTASGSSSTVGGGNYNVVAGDYATVAGGGPTDTGSPTTTNNNAYSPYCTIGGGGGNKAGVSGSTTATYATVAGGYDNTASGAFSMVAGGAANTASGIGSTVSGGDENTASGYNCTVAGGTRNSAGYYFSTVAGGVDNTASAESSTVAGGATNTASGLISTVAGGSENVANADSATVGGGYKNTASAQYATVPGGYDNTAAGSSSFCAGYRAIATSNAYGSFVWADSTNADFSCAVHDRFQVRASGGVYLYTNASLTSGLYLGGGSGTWASLSDRNMKDHFEPIDAVAALDAVVALPISTWNYKSQDPSIRHMGPMAQDLYAAFHLGESDTTIATIDADGVALAAIQGVNQKLEVKVAEQDEKIASQSTEIAALKAENEDLKSRMARIEAMVQQLAAK